MNVLKLGRKALTVSTVFSTMLWSVGVSAFLPVAAQAQTCPAFQPGDMIKVTGRPAIYSVDAAGRVLYFPSGDEFKSWNTGETYGGYTSVSQACFDSLPVPTSAPLGVNFRPGSYVVKRPSSDQLYVVVPGNMLATITVDAAKALYGANYKVMTVADVFWPNYGNTRGAAVTEAKAHPGMLVSNGGKTYFVDSSNTLREVTASGFTANRFKTAFVRPLASVAGYNMGSQVSAFEPTLGDRTQSGVTGTPGTPVTGGALTVSLASDNPAATVLASGTAFNPVLKVNLTAGSQAVNVTGLTIRKSGLAANNAVSGVDVVDAQGVRHGNIASSFTSENNVTILFTGSPIVVPAGSTQTATVRINLDAANGGSGTLQFSLVSAQSVTANGSVSGTFPVTGNTFTLQSGGSAIGAVTTTVSSIANSSVTIDTTNQQDLMKFNVAAGTNENVVFKSVTLYNQGNASDSDVQDVQLVAQDGTVLATAQQVNKNVVFSLVTPYVIDKGTNKNFTVRAKIVAGATRTVQFVIYNDYDVVVSGQSTGAGLVSKGTFPAGTGLNLATIGSGTLSFNKDVSSPSSAVTPGSNGVVFAKFYVKPTGEDMELRKLKLAVTGTPSILTGSLTVKVNGSAVWSGTPTDVTSTVGSPTLITLSTYPTMVAGQNSYITVEGNIVSGASGTSSVQVYAGVGEVKRLLTNDIITTGLGNVVAANSIAVQAATLKVTNLATPVAQSLVAGSNGIELAKIELNAGSSGEDIKVSKIVINDVMANSATSSDIGNLVLYDAAGNALATTANTAINAASTTFNFATPITVVKNTSVTLTLKGDVLGGANNATHKFSAYNATATGISTGNDVSAVATGSGQTMTIATQGTVSISVVTGANASPSADQALAVGTTNVPVFAFKVSAQKESYKLQTLKVTATGTALTVNDIQNLKLFKDSETVPFATAGQMTTSSEGLVYTWTSADNLLSSAVQPGTPVTVYVKADIGGAGTARLGDSFKFSIAATSTDLVAKGVASGVAATVSGSAAVSSLTYVVPFNVSVAATYPTTDLNASLTNGSRLATFKVTNNGSSQITLNSLKVTDLTGGLHSGISFGLKASSQNSTDYSNVDLGAISTTTANTISVTIDGGAHRYLSVYLASGVSGAYSDSYQFAVAAIGDLKFTAVETDLGYDANINGTIDATSTFSAVAADKATAGQISDTTN